jgi:formate hydrogenlyase subunit 6/NADH:ubiquinone oxidoreductase subunit I
MIVASSFVAQLDRETCIGCEACLERCQMGALSMVGDLASLDANRCIGCGLCGTTCPSGALTLKRKPEQPPVPKSVREAMALRVKVRSELKAKLERHQNP